MCISIYRSFRYKKHCNICFYKELLPPQCVNSLTKDYYRIILFKMRYENQGQSTHHVQDHAKSRRITLNHVRLCWVRFSSKMTRAANHCPVAPHVENCSFGVRFPSKMTQGVHPLSEGVHPLRVHPLWGAPKISNFQNFKFQKFQISKKKIMF